MHSSAHPSKVSSLNQAHPPPSPSTHRQLVGVCGARLARRARPATRRQVRALAGGALQLLAAPRALTLHGKQAQLPLVPLLGCGAGACR